MRGAALGCGLNTVGGPKRETCSCPVYGGFTEGFDTTDLESAEALVRELAEAAWAAAPTLERNIVSGFDIDEFGVARAELAQF